MPPALLAFIHQVPISRFPGGSQPEALIVTSVLLDRSDRVKKKPPTMSATTREWCWPRRGVRAVRGPCSGRGRGPGLVLGGAALAVKARCLVGPANG